MWRSLRKALGNNLVVWVDKVARVHQRDGHLRFDLYGAREHPLLPRVLRRLRRRWIGTLCRPHRSWATRRCARHTAARTAYKGRKQHIYGDTGLEDTTNVTGTRGEGVVGERSGNLREPGFANPQRHHANNNSLRDQPQPFPDARETATAAVRAGGDIGLGDQLAWRDGELKVATWNVRSLGGNRPEIALYLRSENI